MITTTLIVPGLHGSGPTHWQSWMEARIAGARRVEQADWDAPVLAHWAAAVRREIERAPGQIFIIAHSFGCLATLAATLDYGEQVAGALLVAPADPNRFTRTGLRVPGDDCVEGGVANDLPASVLPYPSLLVASANDPWLRLTHAGWWAERWGCRFLCLGQAGHINIDSGYGPWPQGLALFEQLRRAQAGAIAGDFADEFSIS